MSLIVKYAICVFAIGIITNNSVLADNVTTSIPRNMTYQGILKNSAGEPVTDTTINIIFRLYDDSTDGVLEWHEIIEVNIDSGGYFDAVLNNLNLPFDEDYYLELEISGDSQPLTPRQKLSMSAYSAFADTCLYAISSGSGADDDWVITGNDMYSGVSGNVGIGTTIPGNKLHVIGSDSIPIVNIEQNGSHRAMRVYSQNACAIWVEYAGNHGLRITNAANNGIHVDSAANFAGWFNGKGYFAGDVGIGETNPSAKLDVDGDINVSDKATIGPGHINTGDYAFVAGQYNEASGINSVVSGGLANVSSGLQATVSGGFENAANAQSATVGGGAHNVANAQGATISGGGTNTASSANSAIGGGVDNTANGISSTISGGHNNSVYGDYSSITGGYSNTIDSSADYSYLYGIASDLTQDSTFMVDMPHIRFGDETNGYEFPTSDGINGQVMSTDGTGQLSWVNLSTVIQSEMKGLLDKIAILEKHNTELENRIAELEKDKK